MDALSISGQSRELRGASASRDARSTPGGLSRTPLSRQQRTAAARQAALPATPEGSAVSSSARMDAERELSSGGTPGSGVQALLFSAAGSYSSYGEDPLTPAEKIAFWKSGEIRALPAEADHMLGGASAAQLPATGAQAGVQRDGGSAAPMQTIRLGSAFAAPPLERLAGAGGENEGGVGVLSSTGRSWAGEHPVDSSGTHCSCCCASRAACCSCCRSC